MTFFRFAFSRFRPYFVIALGFCHYAAAQTGSLKGTVRDDKGIPLIGANVILRNTFLGAACDGNGGYTVRNIPPGRYVAQATMIGYDKAEHTVEIAANETATLDFTLREASLQTDEIVITAGRRPQSLSEVPVSIAVLNADDIAARSFTKLDEALRYVPGVNMTESQVNIRGSSGYSRAVGSRVLLLLDGTPMLAGDASEIKHDAVPMFLIDRIEVVKGAGSALYGSSALGGVINIITKEPVSTEYRIRNYIGFYDNPEYGQWKWWGNSPRYIAGTDVQHADVFGSGSYLVAAGVRNNQSYRKNDESFRWNANGKLNYALTPSQSLSLAANYASERHGNWVFWQGLNKALEPPADADVTEKIHSTKFQASLRYREVLDSRMSYTARLWYFRTAFDTESDTANFALRPTDRVQSTAHSVGAEWQGSLALADGNFLVAGIDGSLNAVDADTYGKRDGYTGAAYAQYETKPLAGLTLSAGARLDYTKIDTADSDSKFNPRLGASYNLIEGTTFRASYGKGFRAPSIAERFANASAGGLATKPNPNLLSETSTSYEVGINQILPLPVVIDLAAFINDYENLVEPTIDPADGKIVFRNITRARIAGFEADVRSVLFDDVLRFSASYTYMYPRDRDLKEVLKYRPRHLVYLGGQLHLWSWKLGGDFRYIGRVEEIDEALGLVIADAGTRVETFVLDLRAGYDFSLGGISFNAILQCNNVLQYNYSEIVGNLAPIRHFLLTVETGL